MNAKLNLTKDEQKLLDGEGGTALEVAMSVLVKLGDLYNADKMIRVHNVHVDASTYGGIHEAGLQFCKRLAREKAKFRVPTTLCISGIDFDQWRDLRVAESFAKKQEELANAYMMMGASPTWTCAPYQYNSEIRYNQDIAWGESNAIAFANSVVGAHTNRYADLVDVCAGLVGKVPRFGLYLDENRRGQVILSIKKIETKHFTSTDYAILGYYVGSTVLQKIPVITGLPHNILIDKLKYFAAAAASSGSVALFHIVGVTPEAMTEKRALGNNVPEEKICIENDELKKISEQLSTIQESRADFIVLGCPHSSVEQIAEVASRLKGRKVRKNVQLWIFTSRIARKLAMDNGYVDIVEKAGGKVLADTCPLHLPLENWNFQIMATDSAKMAHYAPSILGVDVVFARTRDCLDYAIEKKSVVTA